MKNSLLTNLPSFRNQGKTDPKTKLPNPKKQASQKNTQAKFEAMQNIQRASGRRGN